MTAKTAVEELELIELAEDDRGPGGGDHGSGWGGDESARPRLPQHVYTTGMVLALAAILMFFLALTSAYIVRKGLGGDWRSFTWPTLLWWNTGVLVLSSLTIERARRLLASGSQKLFERWWGITTVLGFTFLAGQVVAWSQLAAAGVYMATNPNSAFFYVFTGAHGLHLLGGVAALTYVGRHGQRDFLRVSQATAATVTSIYWHFMDALWVCLFLLITMGQ